MGSDLDGRADQYALAATAFHLLTGTPPYQHSNPVAVISQHLSAAPPKLSRSPPGLAHLDEVLSKALAKGPGDRFARSREFATKLREKALGVAGDGSIEAGLTVSAPKAGTQTQVAVPKRGETPGDSARAQILHHHRRRSHRSGVDAARSLFGRRQWLWSSPSLPPST